MDLIQLGQFNLTGLSKINILLGKNGSGKSSLLKKVETYLTHQNTGEVNYVTPERGGALNYESSVDQNIRSGGDWAKVSKRQNQWTQFKNYSISQYRDLKYYHYGK